MAKVLTPYLETGDEMMMRLALSVLREIICCAVFVSVPVTMNIMEHTLPGESSVKIMFD